MRCQVAAVGSRWQRIPRLAHGIRELLFDALDDFSGICIPSGALNGSRLEQMQSAPLQLHGEVNDRVLFGALRSGRCWVDRAALCRGPTCTGARRFALPNRRRHDRVRKRSRAVAPGDENAPVHDVLGARPLIVLTAPLIYRLIFPLVLLDLAITCRSGRVLSRVRHPESPAQGLPHLRPQVSGLLERSGEGQLRVQFLWEWLTRLLA